MRRGVTRAWLVLVAAAAGCSERASEPAAPTAPARPTLVPRLAEFRARAAAGPARPDEEALVVLRDLVDVALLDVGDPSLSRRAVASLERHEFAGVAYEEGLTHEDAGVRAQCAWRLGELGRAEAIPVLLWRLRYEIDNTVRLWMVDTLTRLGNHARLDVLIELLDDGQVAEQTAPIVLRLAEAAGEEPPGSPTWDDLKGVARRLHRHWRATGRPAGAAPTELGPALEARLAGLVADLTEFQLRPVDRARTALTNMGSLPLPLLLEALSAEELYLRIHTVEIVRDLGRPAAAAGDALLPLLDDPACRVVVIEALGAIGHAPAEERLLAALLDEDLEVRAAAAGALGPLGAAGAVGELRRLVNDGEASLDVRVRAAYSLEVLEETGEGEAFLRALRQSGDYHAPTIDELLARVAAARDEES